MTSSRNQELFVRSSICSALAQAGCAQHPLNTEKWQICAGMSSAGQAHILLYTDVYTYTHTHLVLYSGTLVKKRNRTFSPNRIPRRYTLRTYTHTQHERRKSQGRGGDQALEYTHTESQRNEKTKGERQKARGRQKKNRESKRIEERVF